ncbi:MAG: four helix bundle protein [Ignavibacteria bacterium]
MKTYFDHEKLNVYQKALAFIKWVDSLLKKIKVKNTATDNLDRASTSIAINIAEGNGKYTSKDRCKFFDISRGSTLESASCLDILNVKELISSNDLHDGKTMLNEIVSMLVGLIKSNSNRVFEQEEGYNPKTS